jgi:hypothetical protein
VRHRFTDVAWNSGVDEATEILRQRASRRETISYSDLSRELSAVKIGYHDPDMDSLLIDVSTREHQSGRPLLSVVVVHKQGDMAPGKGFYELASSLGFDASDREAFWIAELNRTFEFWSSHPQAA